MGVLWSLKSAIVERYGSQVEAAKAIGIRESRLSYLIRGHAIPTETEWKSLEIGLGNEKVRGLLRNGEDGN